jgi:hypothetical protein
LSQERHEAFSEEVEKATVFCLAEMEKRKGGGIVIKQPQEKTRFISKTSYPFWLLPFHKTTLIVDGMGTLSHTLPYAKIPEIPAFVESVEKSSGSRQTYMACLSGNTNYFQPSEEGEKLVLEGIISDQAITGSLASLLSEAKPFEIQESDASALAPALDEASLSVLGEELESLKSKLSSEVKELGKAIGLLDRTTKSFAKTIRNEIRETRKSFAEELQKHRDPVEEKVGRLRAESDKEVTAVSQRFGKELLQLQKEKVKKENARDSLKNRIARCEAEMKTSARSKNEVAERKWREERDKFKKELSVAESEIRRHEREIKETEDRKTLELLTIKTECDAKIQEASKELVEIELARDAQIQILKQEMSKMEELTFSITKQIDNTAKLRETLISRLDTLGIQQEQDKPALVFMPFYLVCYEYDSKRRYVVVPPSSVNSVRLLTRIKGALGVAKLRQLLTPRSDAVVSFLSRLPSLIENNAALEREIDESGTRTSLLRTKPAQEQILRGLGQLKHEGWIGEKEYEAFSQSSK